MLATSGLLYFVKSNNANILDNKIWRWGGKGGKEMKGRRRGKVRSLSNETGMRRTFKVNEHCKESFLKHTLILKLETLQQCWYKQWELIVTSHFQVSSCLCFKTSSRVENLSYQNEFDLHSWELFGIDSFWDRGQTQPGNGLLKVMAQKVKKEISQFLTYYFPIQRILHWKIFC